MKLLLDFRVPGLPPSVNSMYSWSKTGGVFASKKSKDFKKKMVLLFPKKPRIDVPVALLIEFHVRTLEKYNKRDLDNYLKCTLDGLQLAGQIKNDNKVIFCACVKLRAEKNYIRGYVYEMPEGISAIHSLVPFGLDAKV